MISNIYVGRISEQTKLGPLEDSPDMLELLEDSPDNVGAVKRLSIQRGSCWKTLHTTWKLLEDSPYNVGPVGRLSRQRESC